MKHTSKISETLETYACNMPLKQLQHVQHLPIYFCNIHMKQMQHTSETLETIETYNYNIGGERESLAWGVPWPSDMRALGAPGVWGGAAGVGEEDAGVGERARRGG